MTLEQTKKSRFSYSGCENSGDMLCYLLTGKCLDSNLSSVCSELATATNHAGASSNPGGAATLDSDAKKAIKKAYELEIDSVKSKILLILGLPMLKPHPDFERNFAAITAYTCSGKQGTMYPRE